MDRESQNFSRRESQILAEEKAILPKQKKRKFQNFSRRESYCFKLSDSRRESQNFSRRESYCHRQKQLVKAKILAEEKAIAKAEAEE